MEALERGRLLFARECVFMRGVAALDGLPPAGSPEVAFAGRSNVGKSSLVNALTGRRTLARTSSTPGRTRQLNFFDLGGALTLVDMPGHGYARVSRHESQAWTALVRAYLRGRPCLRLLCLLADSRQGLKPPDIDLMDMLDEAGVPYRIILTKADKAPAPVRAVTARGIAASIAARAAAMPDLLETSAVKGTGVGDLRSILAALAELPAPRAGDQGAEQGEDAA